MCLNNIGDMQRLLGGGINISYVEKLNGERGPHNIAIITVVFGCRVGPLVVHSSLKKIQYKVLFYIIFMHISSQSVPLSKKPQFSVTNSACAIW